MWFKVLGWIVQVLPVIPSLVTDVENLWRGRAKAGPQKWLSVEQALSGSIAEVAQEAAKLAPDGTPAEKISTEVAIFAKAVNDAAVTLANALGVFQHTPAPPTA